MALTTDARTVIAAALADAGLPAFAYPVETITLPAAVVLPDDPYIVPDRLGPTLRYTAAYQIDLLAQALDNEAGLALCESMIDTALAALPDGVAAERVSRPALTEFGAQGYAYVSSISVTAHLT